MNDHMLVYISNATRTPSRDELDALAPDLDLKGWVTAAGIEAEHVNVMTPSAIEALNGIVTEADPATLRAYLRWQTLAWAAPYLTSELDDETFAFFSTELSGQTHASVCHLR